MCNKQITIYGMKQITSCLVWIENGMKQRWSTLRENQSSHWGGATLCIGGAMAPPNFFKTSLIISKTRLESF